MLTKRKDKSFFQSTIQLKKQKLSHSYDNNNNNNDNDNLTSPYFILPFQLQDFELKQGFVQYSPCFLTTSFASNVFNILKENISFSHSKIKIYGREIDTPRQQAWMSDSNVTPQLFSKKKALSWSSEIRIIKNKLEELCNFTFDYVLINLYRNGNDYIAYHSDSEAIGDNKNIIASISLGATRKFVLRHKNWKIDNIPKKEFSLVNGSLIIMKGDDTQKYWKHTVPKTKRVHEPRINLTFRHS